MTPSAIDRYEVRGQLGQGGMGTVLLAWDPALGREVALKLLLAPDDEAARRRFEIETAALVRLRHANLVRCHSAGEHEGRPFLVLDRVEGSTLAERLRAGPLPPAEAAALAETLADALAHAHAQGVLHRDLKPENVILRADHGEPVVVDFGLARDLAASRSSPTRTGAVLGSPGYWAPEQAAGRPAEVGPWTDVYGLGALLYAALTGAPPVEAATFVEAMVAAVSQEPALPSRRAPNVPEPLERVCLRCLAKDPAARYPDAAALRDDLARVRRGEPVLAAPARPRSRAAPALGLAALGLGAAGLWLLARGSGAAPQDQLPPPVSAPAEVPVPPASGEGLPARFDPTAYRGATPQQLAEALRPLERAPAWQLVARDAALLPPLETLGVERDLLQRSREREAAARRLRMARAGLGTGWVTLALDFAAGRGALADPALARALLRAALSCGEGAAFPVLAELYAREARAAEERAAATLAQATGGRAVGADDLQAAWDLVRADLERALPLPYAAHTGRRAPSTLSREVRARRRAWLLARASRRPGTWSRLAGWAQTLASAAAPTGDADLEAQAERVLAEARPGSTAYKGGLALLYRAAEDGSGDALLRLAGELGARRIEREDVPTALAALHCLFADVAKPRALVALARVYRLDDQPARAEACIRVALVVGGRKDLGLANEELNRLRFGGWALQEHPLERCWTEYWIAAEEDLVAAGLFEPLPPLGPR
ncbi:MAG: protein kinase [Planctomycetota bacterium]